MTSQLPASPPALAAGMTLIFGDAFAAPLNTSRWYPGPKPDGGQWGGAHLVRADEPQFAEAYTVENGVLRLRTKNDPAYNDPEKWGRKWWGAQASTALPNGHTTGAVREGYFQVRAKLPKGRGAWSAFWLMNKSSIKKRKSEFNGTIEVDFMEAYGFDTTFYTANFHDWRSGTDAKHSDNHIGPTPDLSLAFHDYGCRVTKTEFICDLDGVEKVRWPHPRPNDPDPFYLLIDVNIRSDWQVEIPASRAYDLLVEHVRIYQAP